LPPVIYYKLTLSLVDVGSPTVIKFLKTLAFVGEGMVGLSLGEKHFIQGGIAQDLRCDGRKRLAYRPISVETGVIPQVML